MLIPIALMVIGGDDCCASMKVFAKDPGFRAEHLAPEKISFTPQHGSVGTLDYGAGKAPVFIVPPARKARAAVIVIHEWWGLNDYIKREAERLHKDTGYGVVAIDLYGGKVATTSEEAGKLIQTVDDAVAKAIVMAAPEQIKTGTLFGRKLDKVGTLGWCFGGGWSFQTALLGGDKVDACALYYGMPETDPVKLRDLKAPVLGIFGNQDQRLNAALVGKFAEGMAGAARPLELRVYAAGHAFANPSNPKYDKKNAEDAWQATLVFFKRYL